MPDFDYNKARATAEKVISKFGKAGVVTKKGVTGGRDAFNQPIADDPDTNIDGIITPLLQYKAAEIDGESIKKGDAYVFFHSAIAPEINMQTTINGATFRIIDIYEMNSVDGINVFRRLQLRK